MVFSLFLTANQVPQHVSEWIGQSNLNKYAFFAATNLMFFIMGTFLEAVSITLITLPVLLPIIYALDIDIVQFAVVMTVNMELAMITPPVGLNLFVVSAMAKEKLEEVVRGVWPFIIILIGVLILYVLWPDISTYIPREVLKHPK
ncbi:MAG: TRAP transporter large permease subunit [Desulfocucumaceae bacterium]